MVRESQRVILRWQSCVCRLSVISDLALVLGFPLPFIWRSLAFGVWRVWVQRVQEEMVQEMVQR